MFSNNSKCEKQIILLLIPNEEKEGWHYLAVKRLPVLLRGITLKDNGDFYCLNCFHSFRIENSLSCMKKDVKRCFWIILPAQRNDILEFDQYMKSDKMPYIVYADIESLIKQIDNCKNDPEKYSIAKIGKRIPCKYSMSSIWAFDHIENKHSLYHRKDYEKVLQIFKRSCKKYYWFWKEENVTINKRRTKITSRCDRILHL